MHLKSLHYDAVYIITEGDKLTKYQRVINFLSTLKLSTRVKKLIISTRRQKNSSIAIDKDYKHLEAQVEIMSNALKCQEEKILVLDENVRPLFSKKNILKKWNEIHSTIPENWHVVYFGGEITDNHSHRPLINENKNFHRIKGCLSTGAVAYNTSFIKNNLSKITERLAGIKSINTNSSLPEILNELINDNVIAYAPKKLFFGIEPESVSNREIIRKTINTQIAKNAYFSRLASSFCIPCLDTNNPKNYLSKGLKFKHTYLHLVQIKHLKDISSWPNIVLTDHFLNGRLIKDLKNKYKIRVFAWVLEPKAISPDLYEKILAVSKLCEKIFTHDRNLLNNIHNGVYTPVGDCWLEDNDQQIYEKSVNISFLSSSKTHTVGHKLRHEIYGVFKNHFDICKLGGPKAPIIDFFKTPRFSIVVENNRTKGYFTEKIIHCFRSGTIPIYWGDPDIGKSFDPNGIITFSSIGSLAETLKICNEKTYLEKLESVKNNFYIGKKYSSLAKNLLKSFSSVYEEETNYEI